jgi:radical SAM superfamily enzyme YgiQ (UPF0313 family)
MEMLLLVNTNRMVPPIAPVGLDYLAGAARQAGVQTEIVDLCLAGDSAAALRQALAGRAVDLVGVSFRNLDDCFWPSAAWFVPLLEETVASVRAETDAPVVLGGTGYSIFPERILEVAGADFGVRGDGEQALVMLLSELAGRRNFQRVPGLVWRQDGRVRSNAPAWPEAVSLPVARDAVDNRTYFRLGGQLGLETKRGCDRACVFCVDPLAKGTALRVRRPAEVADEVESLLRQGADVLHLCDSEFNIPRTHALAVCRELVRRRLGGRVRWYTYMAATPFDAELASAMRRAGCVGINFTAPALCPTMLAAYRQVHTCEDLAQAVRLCRQNGITVMLDAMLAGPGETPRTVREGIEFAKAVNPDCVGVGVGVRLGPGLKITDMVAQEAPLEVNPGIRRHYDGPIDLLRPTFYISPALGESPAALVRDAIAGDRRFFEPADDLSDQPRQSGLAPPPPGPTDPGTPPADGQKPADQRGYNYNDNQPLVQAIAAGARGAYWDILRRLRLGVR